MEVEYPTDKTIQLLFEEQVEKSPDCIALVFEDQQLTYRELNIRANQLAHYIRHIYKTTYFTPLPPDTLIALCIERSLEMVIAMLAILKAGAAYVPLEPNFPQERLICILQDTNARILLTNEYYQKKLHLNWSSKDNQSLIIALNNSAVKKQCEFLSKENPNSINLSNNLAYVIYTSGTTGLPKGVMITHQAVISRIYYLISNHNINPSLNIAAKIPYIFDPSVREIFLSLLSGSRLVIFSEDVNNNTDKLIEHIINSNINLVIFVPSHLYIVLTHIKGLSRHKLAMSKLKIIYCCGEILTKNLISEIENYFPNLTIKNQYGPTEGCLFSFEYDLAQPLTNSTNIPVGKIVDNMNGYVLDNQLNQLPIGEIGEIYLSGHGLARGYFNLPALTAEKFIPNPFQNALVALPINSRLYKTGDLGRWLPDGNLEFIGRNDFQVKIRGYRIELSEIEQAILTYPGIKQVVVIAHEINISTKWLVAYFVLDKNFEEVAEKLRTHLNKILPDYMIPNIFITLDNFPITQNGKLDRKALPTPNILHTAKDYVPPSTKLEQQLVKIWSKVLMIKEHIVGINDNFFHLGGDSFTAMQMTNQAKFKQININAKDIKNHPTIAQLANSIQQNNHNSFAESDQLVDDRELTLPLLPFHRNLPFSPLINARLVRLKNGRLDGKRLEDALQKLIRRHSVLRTKIVYEDRNWIQKLFPYNNRPVLKHVNFQQESVQNIESLITLHLKKLVQEIEENFISFAGIYFSGPNENFFLCVLSHHHFDVLSQMIFWQELGLAYQDKPLPNIKLSYSEIVRKLHVLAEYNKITQLPFWEKQLKNVKSFNFASFPLEEKTSNHLNQLYQANWLKMEPELDKTLFPFKRISKISQVPIHDLLLTAWVQVLCEHFKLQEVVINLVMHGRGIEEDEIDNIGGAIGCFVSHYPICFTFPPGKGKMAVNHIRALINQAPNKGMRYGLLRYARPDLITFWEKLPLPNLFFHFQTATKEEEHTGIWQVVKEQRFNELLMHDRLEPLWILNPKTNKSVCSMLFGQSYNKKDIEELWSHYFQQIQQLASEIIVDDEHSCKREIYAQSYK